MDAVNPSEEAVFLSASVPDPLRHPKYITTVDVMAIREAVRALVAVVTPNRKLVFGGHPAISPFVLLAADELGKRDQVVIFVSEHFRNVVPQDNLVFPNLVWTPAVSGGRDASLRLMREEMLGGFTMTAGVFLGGMEGVEAEHELFEQLCPLAPSYPVASTGAAARLLFDAHRGVSDPAVRVALENEYTFFALFGRLPGIKS
ncbi:MAG: hypothetical protein JNK72_04375 [Myxococcales bacterium]|nr:hypothetical protein [Myxococcales bacterium]